MEKVFNNEVMIFGKLVRALAIVRINYMNAIRLELEVKDDYFPDRINRVYVYALGLDRKQMKNVIDKEVGINGHVITHKGTKVIVDAIKVI